MFKKVDLLGVVGPVKGAWLKLIRTIQTEVEHKRVTNADAGDFVKGDILFDIAGNRQMQLADASAAASSEWVGVAAEPIVATELGVMRTRGYALVHFVDGLAITEGAPAYLSAVTAGCADVAAPQVAGFEIRVGIIADGTVYDDTPGDTYFPYAWVVLGHCCEPEPVVG